MFRFASLAAAAFFVSGHAMAEDLDAAKLHSQFTGAFNSRNWDSVKAMLAEDIVFHRASGDTVFIGPDAVIERFSGTIGSPDQWNVKFVKLDSDSDFTGKDGRIVERGDFAVTAGGDDGACYAGSYMMTWADKAGWKLQLLAWQDVETDLANCN